MVTVAGIAGLEEIRAQTGPTWNPTGLLFPNPEGGWLNPPASQEFGVITIMPTLALCRSRPGRARQSG
jgi:hypothetical protein